MNEFDGFVESLGYALHVHEARRVGTCDIFGTRSHVALYFVGSHLYRHSLLLHGEHSSEAAAFIHAFRFLYGYALHELQQVLDF